MGCLCLKGLLVKRKNSTRPHAVRALVKEMIVRFEEKPRPEQEDILIYLHMNWKDLQHDSSLIEALEKTRFVTTGDGDLYRPKDLFDPGDALLTLLFSSQHSKFPGERFGSDEWLSILRITGLQNTRDADTVLQCARRIEFLGAQSMKHDQVSLEVWSLAETLVDTILENSTLLHDHSFCNVFGKIACVPAEKGFPLETGKRGVTRVLCSYKDAILMKDWPLAWNVAPILSKVPPDYAWGALQVMSPPPFSLVLKHLQHIKKSLSRSFILAYEEATFEVLKYLDTKWGALSSSDVSKLSKLSFIPTADVSNIVKANFFVSHLKIDLWPIAQELPLRYLPFVRILKELGLHDTLSMSIAKMFLLKLRHNLLGPDELRAAIELLYYICDEMEQNKSDNISNWASGFVVLVPDSDRRLVHPNLCLYIDPLGSRYVKYIDSSKLRLVHHDVSERLCVAFGVKKLSDVVVEELDCVGDLQTLEEIGSVSLPAIRLKLLSRSFQVAVSSVVNGFSSITSAFKNPDFLTLERLLDSVAERLQFVRSLYTRFRLLPKYLEATRASVDSVLPEWDSHRALYYVDRSNTCMLIAEPPSYMSVLDLVAIVVSRVLGSPVPLPIASLLLCPQDLETELVNMLKLSSDEREIDSGTGIGRDILPQDAMQVQLLPFRPFYKGEIVAWQTQKGEKLKYGRITEDVRPSTGQALYRICVETSRWRTETIISSHVFWFGNFSKSSTHTRTIKELERGHVPAIEEMLSVAGINMDMNKQSLDQNIMSLQQRLNESQAALVLEQVKLEMARKEVYTAQVALLCRICLTNVTDITIVPCGHVLCHQCSYVVSHCPFCRVKFSTTIRIQWYS